MKPILNSAITLSTVLISAHLINATSDRTFDVPVLTRISDNIDNEFELHGEHQYFEAQSELDQYLSQRSNQIASHHSAARAKLAQHRPDPANLQKLSKKDVQDLYDPAAKIKFGEYNNDRQNFLRRMSWYGNDNSGSSVYEHEFLANPGGEIDSWAQAYRMLGGFIDCDNEKDDSHDSGDEGSDGYGCSRWMMWAAYYNPTYGGGGRDEYFNYGEDEFYSYESGNYYNITNEPVSRLDCHNPETEWVLIGVYREEFYQFLEQISKHLWAIDEYEYVVALAGLAYMTDADCWQVGNDDDGTAIYAGIQPLSGGNFQISLYTDGVCLNPDDTLGMTFDDFGLTSSMQLSSGDGGNDDGAYDDDVYANLYAYWQETQEYTLTLLNEVYEEYKYCTLCMDYPTYQDGYFIGDDGTDEDDLINQCWKFHSHDSFNCESDCLALGDAQGSIVEVRYGDSYFGSRWDGSSGTGTDTHYDHYKQNYTTDENALRMQRLKSNAFLSFSGILFVATFLAFAVTKGSLGGSGKHGLDESLLDDDIAKPYEHERTSRSRGTRSTRSRSKKRNDQKRRSRSHHSKKKKSNSRKKPDDSLDCELNANNSWNSVAISSSRRKKKTREFDDF